MQLTNKVILIVSPQAWGNMFLAKHHYAIELAKHGNEVYFLNPAIEAKYSSSIEIVNSNVINNLFLINHQLPSVLLKIKFKIKLLFHFYIKTHIKKIEQAIGKKVDIIINYDLGDYYPFKYFSNNPFKIYFPIDEPLNKDGIDSAKDCDIIFSITKEILEKYNIYNVPKHFVHHGLAEEFKHSYQQIKLDNKIRFGLSGNWLRKDLDRDTLLEIIKQNDDVIFEFWGSYKAKQSNIGGADDSEMKRFIAELMVAQNVVLHGPIHPSKLAEEYKRMDGFIICYDILKDQSRGTNYHKVMEYLSTGKVIVSNNVTTYANMTNMMAMSSSRINNNELPVLFKQVVNNLEYYNMEQFQNSRVQFAHSNLYSKKIDEIVKRCKTATTIFDDKSSESIGLR